MALRKKRLAAQQAATGGAEDNSNDLETLVKTGPSGAYEALQLFRSKAIRFKSKNDPEAALKTLAVGCTSLLENGYENAGAELSVLFLEQLNEMNKDIELDAEVRDIVYKIDGSYPVMSPKRVEFLKGSLKWTIACGTRALGDPAIHHRLAACLWDVEDKGASYHFAAGEAPGLLCDAIFAKYPEKEKDQQAKRDRALTTGIVHFLSLENLRDANELHTQFQKQQKARKFTANSELLQFCTYLLQICRRDAGTLFKSLVNSYTNALDYDEAVTTLIMGPIAFKFFKIQPKVNPMMSMLQNMIK
jgi:hypothetical protein